MGKIYSNSITTTGGFTFNSDMPLDDRLVVETLDDLSSLTKYDGILVFVKNENKHYTYATVTSEDEDPKKDWVVFSGEKPDLTDYATKDFVTTKIAEAKVEGQDIDLSIYAKTEDLANYAKIEDLDASKIVVYTAGEIPYVREQGTALNIVSDLAYAIDDNHKAIDSVKSDVKDLADNKAAVAHTHTEYITETALNQSLEDYATKVFVADEIAKVQPGSGGVDLTSYATMDYVDKAIAGITTDNIDLSNYYTKAEVDNEIELNTGTIVYTEHESSVGHRIEMPDVYPIQQDISFKVISRNMFMPDPGLQTDNGIISLTATSSGTFNLGTASIEAPCKYVVKVYDYVPESTLTLVISGSKFADGVEKNRFTNLIIPDTGIVEIDSRLLDINTISISAVTTAAVTKTLKICVECREASESFIPYIPVKDLSDIAVNVYGRNILTTDSIAVENIKLNSTVRLADSSDTELCSLFVSTMGAHTMYGTMTKDDGKIKLTCDNYAVEFAVPLIAGDEFTFIFKCTTEEDRIDTVALMLGHIVEPVYEDYCLHTLTCDSTGNCDTSAINFPYSLVTLSEEAYKAGYSLYIKWDSALTRSWIEDQLRLVDKRLDTIEESAAVSPTTPPATMPDDYIIEHGTPQTDFGKAY